MKRGPIFGWAMYDFANSAYTTVIVTVAYAVVFPRLIVGDGPDYRLGNLLWSATLATSYAAAVLTLPVLGAAMDRSGRRKAFLAVSTVVTVAATASLWFVGPGAVLLAMVLVATSNYGYSLGESFVASFLPELGPPERLGRISGMAWALGYVGGLVSAAVVVFGLGPATVENMDMQRLIGPVTAGWFALACVPTFLLLPDGRPSPSAESPLAALRRTWRDVRRYRDLVVFLASFVFAMAGLSIVISFAFIYGDQVIRWSEGTKAAMFVLTQISATGGALVFGLVQHRLGDKATYALTLVVWIGAVLLLWSTPTVARTAAALGLGVSAEQVFLVVGTGAGLCLGATQSAGRTLVALFSPPDRTGEFFGLWGMAGKIAAIVGLLSIGALQVAVGLQNAILVCALFFAGALLLSTRIDVDRGRAAARGAPVV